MTYIHFDFAEEAALPTWESFRATAHKGVSKLYLDIVQHVESTNYAAQHRMERKEHKNNRDQRAQRIKRQAARRKAVHA